MDDTQNLEGNIQLTGFKSLEPSEMVVLKKIVSTYARHFSSKCKKFELLKVSMKKVHELEHSEKYEIHAMVVDGGKQHPSKITERNLFMALDSALKKVENSISK